jgi:hypothetical protein
MKGLSKYSLISVVLLFFVYGITVAQVNSLRVTPDGNVIKIYWRSEASSNINHFEIYRSISRTGLFERINPNDYLPHHGNPDYEYIDQNLFKSSGGIFYYKIRTVFNDNSYQDTSPVATSYTSSTARRTWGSIKAMFR